MTDLELTAALATAFNQYDASSLDAIIHDTFRFESQMSFNVFDSKESYIEFCAKAFAAMKSAGVEVSAELVYTSEQPWGGESGGDKRSNIKLMYVTGGQPCIYVSIRLTHTGIRG